MASTTSFEWSNADQVAETPPPERRVRDALHRIERIISTRGEQADIVVMDTEYFRPAVARGAGFLDKLLTAPGWRPRIDLTRLNLADSHCCILGQLYGDYNAVVHRLDMPPGGSIELGFSVNGYSCLCCTDPRERAAWDALTEAWRRELLMPVIAFAEAN